MEFIPINSSPITTAQAREINPLVLAFVGDSVHSLYTKTCLVSTSMAKINVMHTKCSAQVKAQSQAAKMMAVMPLLTQEENDVYMRARNTHVNTIAKNASLAEYKQATGYEALIGYLYLTGQNERLQVVLEVK